MTRDRLDRIGERLKDRLLNWKFASAARLLAGDDTEAASVIHALAAQFGNCGHFDGDMGDLIAAVVGLLERDLSATAETIAAKVDATP